MFFFSSGYFENWRGHILSFDVREKVLSVDKVLRPDFIELRREVFGLKLSLVSL